MNARMQLELGKLCARGHDHEGTGRSLRRRGACVQCINLANRAARGRLREIRSRAPSTEPAAPLPPAAPLRLKPEERAHRRHSLPIRPEVTECPCPRLRPRKTPCPRSWCRFHLGDIGDRGVDLTESCALDLADRGELILEDIAELLGVTRQRVDQIEKSAIAKLRADPAARELLDQIIQRKATYAEQAELLGITGALMDLRGPSGSWRR